MTSKVSKEEFFANFSNKTNEDIRSMLASKPKGHLTKAQLLDLAFSEYEGTEPDAELLETAPTKKLIQARIKDERDSFRRAGYVFTRKWLTLDPQPTGEVLAKLKAEKAIQIREA